MKRWVKGKKGKHKVDAEPCDVEGLFINKDPDTPEHGWCITHRLTGLRVGPYYFKKRRDAVRVAQLLTYEHGIDWTIADEKKLVDRHPFIQRQMMKIVHEKVKGAWLEVA